MRLRQYFAHKNMPIDLDWRGVAESDTGAVFEAVSGLPPAMQRVVEGDFRAINDLACAPGVVAILEEAAFWGHDWSADFEAMSSAYERAIWTFLNEPRRFEAAGSFHEMDRLGGWKRRTVGKLLDVATSSDDLAALEAGLREFYRKQGRGRFCHVDPYERRDPERHCFFAYPENFADNEIGYDDDGAFRHLARRAAFEVIFIYRPDEGILEVHAKGGKRVVANLMEIFCTTILGLQGLPDDDHLPFDLTVLKDPSFAFPTEPKDQVAHVDVQQLRLDLAGDGSNRSRRRVTLSTPSSPQSADTMHDLIDDIINQESAPLDTLHPSQAKIRFTFNPVDDKRPKTLTFDVTYPDGCTLKDDPHDQIAKKYLRRWGIARG